MGWMPVGLLALLGLLTLAVVTARAARAVGRTRSASATLTTAVTGRTRRLAVGLAETRAWREAHRHPDPAATPAEESSVVPTAEHAAG